MDKFVHAVGVGPLIACLDEATARSEVEQEALGMADWRDALPPDGESTIAFCDSSSPNDVLKTNLAGMLDQLGLGNIRRL